MPNEKNGATLPCFYGTEVIKEAFGNIAEFGKITAPAFFIFASERWLRRRKKSEYAEVMSTEISSISGVREICQPVQDANSWCDSTKETDLFLPLKMMILGHLSRRPSPVQSKRYCLLATSLTRPQKVPLPSTCSQGLAM